MDLDIKKLNPWNWFKKEEEGERRNVPVARRGGSGQELTSGSYYSPLWSLHNEIDQMFDNVFRSFGLPSLGTESALPSLESNWFRPSVDIDSSEKEYRITVEVPGVDEKDVKLELDRDGTLTIRGEKKQEREEKDRDFYRVERSYGSFQRVLSLPEDADQDSINASFKNGVLTLTVQRKALPKSEARQIGINTGNDNKSSGSKKAA